jgi:hypothetical protein
MFERRTNLSLALFSVGQNPILSSQQNALIHPARRQKSLTEDMKTGSKPKVELAYYLMGISFLPSHFIALANFSLTY